MRAGKLRHRITLQSRTLLQNGLGENEETFNTYAAMWAEVIPTGGKERDFHSQIYAEASYKIITRKWYDISETDIILFKNKRLQIVAPPINIGERNYAMEIYCKEVD